MTATGKQTRAALRPPTSGVRGGVSSSIKNGNAFPKSARLLKHADFQRVYETGRKQFSSSMIFFFILKPNGARSLQDSAAASSHDCAPSLSPSFGDRVGATSVVHVGITVGRVLGGAVDRNRIKRRMRDVVRHQHAGLMNALNARGLSAEIVINPKKSVLTADIAALRAEVERGFGIIAAANVLAPRAAQPKADVPQNVSQKTGDSRTK